MGVVVKSATFRIRDVVFIKDLNISLSYHKADHLDSILAKTK